jgi:DNA polymerase-3 subunit epsilon
LLAGHKDYFYSKFMDTFAAIDFETATGYRDSICSVGIVTVSNGLITDEYHSLCQPPENEYWYGNVRVHGITPDMTDHLPGFHAVYPEIKKRLQGKVVIAHNEAFDRNVLQAAMRTYQLDYDELQLPVRWECTCKIYRNMGYKPATLSACCEKNGIELNHHEALSDARGCAMLYLAYLNNTNRADK